jgi:hypothetical protein
MTVFALTTAVAQPTSMMMNPMLYNMAPTFNNITTNIPNLSIDTTI